jgi:GH25 family lysozyme M1 (1,4-beta-N-acetylmuramidase)
MRGIDISHYQIIDWSKVKTDFIIQKCTEALTFKDPTYAKNKQECAKRNIPFSAYHFFRDVDPILQAEFFVKTAGDCQYYILDFEIHISNPVEKCNAFLGKVEELTGKKPIIYLNSSTAKSYDWDTNWPLWIANYNINDGTQHLNPDTGKWDKFWAHQYTSRGKVEGISGFVDLNYMPNKETIMNYTPYSQTDLRWRFKFLGNSWSTIGSYGCYLTSLSMMVGKRPDEVNEILKKAGAFDKDFIKQEEAAKALGLDFLGREYNINNEPHFTPTIKEVNYNRTGTKFSQHFVLRIIENNIKYIIDPLGGVKRNIAYYPFRSYRLFKKKLP